MKALIMWGGWDGHTPEAAAKVMETELERNGFTVAVADSLTPLEDADYLADQSLIMPIWTMGELSKEQGANLNQAVRNGVGFAGFHGGAGDSFRGNVDYEWMVGGHFVGHPYVGEYTVKTKDLSHPITHNLPDQFTYDSEQYYMKIDPAVEVLATTIYDFENTQVEMPVIWTRDWGAGRVFYSALGHVAEEFEKYPDVLAMTVRGALWAARREE